MVSFADYIVFMYCVCHCNSRHTRARIGFLLQSRGALLSYIYIGKVHVSLEAIRHATRHCWTTPSLACNNVAHLHNAHPLGSDHLGRLFCHNIAYVCFNSIEGILN